MNRLKELRDRAGMQQKEVAIAVGVARPTVSEWEHQKKDPTGDRLTKLAELFGVSTGVILCYDQIPGTEPSNDRLTPDEYALLRAWRAADEGGRDAAMRVLLASPRTKEKAGA